MPNPWPREVGYAFESPRRYNEHLVCTPFLEASARRAAAFFVVGALIACDGSAAPEGTDAGRPRPQTDGGQGDHAEDSGGAYGEADGGAEPVDPPCPPLADAAGEGAFVTHGPLLGAVSDTSVKVWIRGEADGEFHVRFWPTSDPSAVRCSELGRTSAATSFTGVVRLAGLAPDTEHSYVVYAGASGEASQAGDVATFRTLPPRGSSSQIRFVTAGDVNGANVPGFDDIAAVAPAFVLMLGDNVYADGFGETREVYEGRYQTVWSGRQFQSLFSRVPVFSMWDDHELVDNYWAGKNDEVYAFARPLFDDYQGRRNPEPRVPGELYFAFDAGEVGFFVLDTRTHRSPNTDPDGPDKSMLGEEQRAALVRWLGDSRRRVHVIVSSVLMSDFSTTGSDSWRSFADEREQILDAVGEAGTENVLVVSGDQHWSAVLRLDRGAPDSYSVYEFQTTPLAFSERGVPSPVDDTVVALDNTHRVFGVFDVDTRSDPPALVFTLCAVGAECRPGEEPMPDFAAPATVVPYTVRFEGGAAGFRMLP